MTRAPAPVIYRKSRIAAALYAIPIALARRQLGETPLFPISVAGYGLVHATWFDYGDTTIGPYREFSLGVVASPEPLGVATMASLLFASTPPLGAFVLALPVDSEPARAGGVKLYGLPKSLLDFALHWEKKALNAALTEQSEPVLEMRLPLGHGLPVWMRSFVVYSLRANRLLTTRVATRWFAQLDLVGRPQLEVRGRNHPLGQLATELGLEAARAVAVMHGPLAYAELPPPDDMKHGIGWLR